MDRPKAKIAFSLVLILTIYASIYVHEYVHVIGITLDPRLDFKEIQMPCQSDPDTPIDGFLGQAVACTIPEWNLSYFDGMSMEEWDAEVDDMKSEFWMNEFPPVLIQLLFTGFMVWLFGFRFRMVL